MKKLFCFFIFPILVTAMGFYSYYRFDLWYYFAPKEEQYFYDKLNEAIKAGKTEIPIEELTQFEWEEVCYYGAYNGLSAHYQYTGEMPEAAEGQLVLALIKNSRVQHFIIIKEPYYAEEISNSGCFASKAKIFLENKQFTIRN